MKAFDVWGVVTGTKFLGMYEAETKAEAIQKALRENGSVSLCHQCSDELEDAQIEDAYADEL